jgi:hypothetical protein
MSHGSDDVAAVAAVGIAKRTEMIRATTAPNTVAERAWRYERMAGPSESGYQILDPQGGGVCGGKLRRP